METIQNKESLCYCVCVVRWWVSVQVCFYDTLSGVASGFRYEPTERLKRSDVTLNTFITAGGKSEERKKLVFLYVVSCCPSLSHCERINQLQCNDSIKYSWSQSPMKSYRSFYLNYECKLPIMKEQLCNLGKITNVCVSGYSELTIRQWPPAAEERDWSWWQVMRLNDGVTEGEVATVILGPEPPHRKKTPFTHGARTIKVLLTLLSFVQTSSNDVIFSTHLKKPGVKKRSKWIKFYLVEQFQYTNSSIIIKPTAIQCLLVLFCYDMRNVIKHLSIFTTSADGQTPSLSASANHQPRTVHWQPLHQLELLYKINSAS